MQGCLSGTPLKRTEDPRFITGSGNYVDDFHPPGLLHAGIARSPYAHAKINSIDKSEAMKIPGVVTILVGEDISKDIPTLPLSTKEGVVSTPRPPLAIDEVNYVGDPVAIVIADNQYSAADAVEVIQVDYTPLPVISNPLKALETNSPNVHSSSENNVAWTYNRTKGDIESVFASAYRVIKTTLVNQRVSPLPMEPRGLLASYDESNGHLTVWLSTQGPFEARAELAKLLKLSENKIRVIAPDVGGAFGQKIAIYPEDALICYASIKLGVPIKWIETRMEHMLGSGHGRDQIDFVEAAVNSDGKLLGLKLKVIADIGAYSEWITLEMGELTINMGPGPYTVQAYTGECVAVFTNKVPVVPYRGAGRPEATYLMERLMDRISKELNMDPTEVRRKNFVPSDKFPYKTLSFYEYDSGNYEGTLQKAIDEINYLEWREKQKKLRSEGKYIGIGISSYVEVCGFDPSGLAITSVDITKSGKVNVISGTSPHGQGHAICLAQVVADDLGIPLDDITIQFADTSQLPSGVMTGGSRSLSFGGSAILSATKKIKHKMLDVAAHLLESRREDLTYYEGKATVKGMPSKSISFSQLAEAAYSPNVLSEDFEPGLAAYGAFSPSNYTFPFGTHIAIVEVDTKTGVVTIMDYLAADDVGNVINPMIVEGQVHGGVLQGISQALWEEIIYDEGGQLMTASLVDYAIPTAYEAPQIKTVRTVTPSQSNPLGVKGIGETGAIAAPAAIINAIEDALSPFNIQLNEMPAKPDSILELIVEAKE